jgi:hypothetical protein
MLMVWNLFEDRWSAIAELRQNLILRFSEKRAHDAEAPFQYTF